MAKYVHEIMNSVTFCVADREATAWVVHRLESLGIHGAPVVDDEGRPCGFFSRSDAYRGDRVREAMSTPAKGLSRDAVIEDAAALMESEDLHHLVVVNGEGRVCGVLSTLDVLRAILGEPKRHPSAFPRWDREAGVVWNDVRTLDAHG